MKKLLFLLSAALYCLTPQAQCLHTSHPMLDSAFSLAVWTIDTNTHQGILHAGGGYGGEWTRDASINALNVVSLLRPQVAEHSLWNVTEDSMRIGHQYWDKMLWALAAWQHYQSTSDTAFLQKAYPCALRTLQELESTCFDPSYGLFMGPAVFQDGIEAYPEPIYDPRKWDDSFVLHHPHSDSIRCLSTNVMYAEAYRSLWSMSIELGEEVPALHDKYLALIHNIQKHLYDSHSHRYYYLIDHQGHRHAYQEGLGVSLALLNPDLLSQRECRRMVRKLTIGCYGLPSVSPSFPRNSMACPGRHNMMIWPHINAFFAMGCAHRGIRDEFYRELENIARLAMVNGNGNFYEIYTLDGIPSGGWQCHALWDKKEHQSWCATGFLRLWIEGVFGLTFSRSHLYLLPMGLNDGSECTLSGIRWRGNDITITVRGKNDLRSSKPQKILLNGLPTTDNEVHPNQGILHYDITL